MEQRETKGWNDHRLIRISEQDGYTAMRRIKFSEIWRNKWVTESKQDLVLFNKYYQVNSTENKRKRKDMKILGSCKRTE